MNKTFREIGAKYEWPNMKRDIENYVMKCQSCQVNKTSDPRLREPMEITTTARNPFEKCALDIVGPTKVTNKGKRYIFTFQDDLTKFVVAEIIPTQDAEITAREFVHNIVLKFGIPAVVLTDQESNILSELFQNICKLLRIKRIHITAFHPNLTVESSGVTRSLSNISDIKSQKNQRDWDGWIPYATRLKFYDSPSPWVLAC
jgi:hypothetical protein